MTEQHSKNLLQNFWDSIKFHKNKDILEHQCG